MPADHLHPGSPLVLFTRAGQPFVLPLAVVERVVRVVDITPPGLDSVEGVLKRDDGRILLRHNLEALLSVVEEVTRG